MWRDKLRLLYLVFSHSRITRVFLMLFKRHTILLSSPHVRHKRLASLLYQGDSETKLTLTKSDDDINHFAECIFGFHKSCAQS